MKSINLLLAFCAIQIGFVLSLPVVFGYNFEPQAIRLESASKEEAISALRLALENERHYKSAISKLYKGIVVESILLLILVFYAKKKILQAKGEQRE